MKTKLFLIALVLSTQLIQAQKYVSKAAHIWFYSHTPVEDIEAHNRQGVSILDATNGDISFSVLIKVFDFKIALMQEHFNENYMESDKFPKAGFKGKITNIDKINFMKDGSYPAEVSGDLTIHGVTKQITTKGTIVIKGQTVTATSKFLVSPKDYDIKIPQVVENKIAKQVEITIESVYNQG